MQIILKKYSKSFKKIYLFSRNAENASKKNFFYNMIEKNLNYKSDDIEINFVEGNITNYDHLKKLDIEFNTLFFTAGGK
jgi:hypothetical protein